MDPSSLTEDKGNDVGPHFQRLLSDLFRVVVDIGILPSVTEVTFIRIQTNHPVFNENRKGLRWFIVMFMDFWQSFREGKLFGKNGVSGRQLHKILFRKHFSSPFEYKDDPEIVIDEASLRFHVKTQITGVVSKNHVPRW